MPKKEENWEDYIFFIYNFKRKNIFNSQAKRANYSLKDKKWKYEIKSTGKDRDKWSAMFSLGQHGCTCMCTKWSLFCMKMYSIHVWMVLVALVHVFCVSASFFNLKFFKKWGKNKFRNNFLSSIHSSSIFCMNDANSSLENKFLLNDETFKKTLSFSLQSYFLYICTHIWSEMLQ